MKCTCADVPPWNTYHHPFVTKMYLSPATMSETLSLSSLWSLWLSLSHKAHSQCQTQRPHSGKATKWKWQSHTTIPTPPPPPPPASPPMDPTTPPPCSAHIPPKTTTSRFSTKPLRHCTVGLTARNSSPSTSIGPGSGPFPPTTPTTASKSVTPSTPFEDVHGLKARLWTFMKTPSTWCFSTRKNKSSRLSSGICGFIGTGFVAHGTHLF